jgi:hypothetical protein
LAKPLRRLESWEARRRCLWREAGKRKEEIGKGELFGCGGIGKEKDGRLSGEARSNNGNVCLTTAP